MWFVLIGALIGFVGYFAFFGIKKFIDKKKDNNETNDNDIA